MTTTLQPPAGPATATGAAATPSQEPRSRAPRGTRLSPPARLRAQAGAAVLLLAALLVTTLLGLADTAARVHTLTAGSEPRAASAARLYQALADLDAQRAKSLVVGYAAPDPANPAAAPVLVDDGVLAALTAQADQRTASEALAQLSASAGPGRVHGLLDLLALYDAWTGTEEYAVGTQVDPVVGHPQPTALDTYAQADALLQSQLLPQVHTLLTEADAQVSRDRAAAHAAAEGWALLIGVLGAVTVLLLLWWQRDLTRRHRRLLNPALLAAAAAALAVLIGAVPALLGSSAQVDSAVDRGYAPYARLAQASVAGADAEARQSRWVVDDSYREVLAQQFGTDSGQVRSLLAADRDPAAAVIRQRFDAYLGADTALRQVAASGDVNGAALRLTGVGRQDVAFAYYDFAIHLDALATADAAAFDTHAAAASDQLSGWPAAAAALLGLALLLVLAGVRPRLGEYS